VLNFSANSASPREKLQFLGLIDIGEEFAMATTKATAYEKGKLYDLEITKVQPDPEQPRKFFDGQALTELAASITSHGVLQPILVREGAEGVFIIVSGERRYQATQKAGLATIPAIITDGEPADLHHREPAAGEPDRY
jgi:hypothetical protein